MNSTSYILDGKTPPFKESTDIDGDALKEQKTLSNFSKLKQEIKLLGFNKKATGKIIFELVINVILAFVGIAIIVWADSIILKTVGLLISTFGTLGVTTNTHTHSHYATSDHRWVNEFFTYFGYPFFVGLSATYWCHKHLVVHHPNPNIMEIDKDADIMPWFALNQEQIHKSPKIFHFYYQKIQWLVFPFILSVNAFSVQKDGWVFLFGKLQNSKERKLAHWLDLLTLTIHYLFWIVLPIQFLPSELVLNYYILRLILMGYGMYSLFAVAHYPEEAICVVPEEQKNDYILKQTATTINFDGGAIGRFLAAGVDYQIEHHLFPEISHVYYRQMSLLVKKFCEENGYPYRTLSWGKAILKSWLVFKNPKPVEPSLNKLKLSSVKE